MTSPRKVRFVGWPAVVSLVMTSPPRILVAGAGIGGLTAALALRRAGCEAEVFERTPVLRPVGAGIVLAINALLGLRSLGLYERVAAAGTPIESARLVTAGGRPIARTDFSPLVRELGVAAIAFHRAELHRVLLDAVGGGVRLDAEGVGFEQAGGEVRLALADGEVVSGDALVGADGLRSAVRRVLLGEAAPRYSGYTSWRAVTPGGLGLVPRGATTESWGAGRRFGTVGLTGGRTYWFAVENAPEGGADEGDPRGHLLERFGGWHAPIRELLEATPGEAIVRTDIHDREPVATWGAGRVTLLGDAAHPMTPNLGQGACQAVEDAVVLADELAGGGSLEAAFRRYEARRRERTRAVVLQSRRFGRIAQWSNPLARAVRDLGLRALPESATLRPLRAFLSEAPVFRGGGA